MLVLLPSLLGLLECEADDLDDDLALRPAALPCGTVESRSSLADDDETLHPAAFSCEFTLSCEKLVVRVVS